MKLSNFKEYSKGELLLRLKSLESGYAFLIPTLILISCEEWVLSKNHDETIAAIRNKIIGPVIVRSSASDEDSESRSRAGEFVSISNVDVNDASHLKSAISDVINSYVTKGNGIENQHIIVQKMINNVSASGVVFTHELNSGAPYYVVNYDDISGSTSSVTSGAGEYANRTLFVHRDKFSGLRSERFKALLFAVKQIESILGSDCLDVEFGIGIDNKVHIFQVRPISTANNWNDKLRLQINENLSSLHAFVRSRNCKCSGVFGSKPIYSQMTDWNPAEMIGRAPRRLALSLYEKLITDNAWASARNMMGYSAPLGTPLMVIMAGQPYVDVRLSLNSFLPCGLSCKTSSKLVDEWIDRLSENPQLHDKVEFDIAITAYTFDIDDKLDKQATSLDHRERELFKGKLRQLTLPLLRDEGVASISKSLSKIDYLSRVSIPTELTNFSGFADLISNTIEYGTTPFAILARHGFIAKSLLNSLVDSEIINDEDVSSFLASIKTITSEMLEDVSKLNLDFISSEDFLNKYGHLRPGTYDILSKRYDQMDLSVFKSLSLATPINHAPFHIEQNKIVKINDALNNHLLEGVSFESLFLYMSNAIIGREYSKFIFTKSVSAILEILSKIGQRNGLSREQLSHIPIDYFLELSNDSNSYDKMSNLGDLAALNKQKHEMTAAVRLPELITNEDSVYVIPFQVSSPNYITNKSVASNVIILKDVLDYGQLNGSIVFIENADPGYDWVFSHDIGGLITKYGGANSHMAIRCAEFNLPAIIGCGEQLYGELIKCKNIEIDCSSRTFVKIS